MSTLKEHGIDLPNGTPITVASSNTKGNTPFYYVATNTAVLTASTAQKAHGLSSVLVDCPASGGSSAAIQYSYAPSAAIAFSWRMSGYFTGLPSSTVSLMQALCGASVQNPNPLVMSKEGKVGYNYGPAAGPTTVYISAYTIPLNTWLRFEGTVVLDGSGQGSMSLKVFVGDSTTPAAQVTTTGVNTQDTSNTGMSAVQWGKNTTSPTMGDFYLDDFAVRDDAVPIGPFVADQPSVIASAAVSGTTLTLSEVAYTYDGVAPTTAWAQTAGPTVALSSASAPSPTATLAQAGNYGFRVTITDDLGHTAYDDITFTYSGNVAAPSVTGAAVGTANWVESVTGTAANGGALTYSISPSTGVTQVAPGVFTGPVPQSATHYTVTVSEAGNAQTTQFGFTVAGLPSQSGAGVRILLANKDQSAGGVFS
jgi:hypothetical protein